MSPVHRVLELALLVLAPALQAADTLSAFGYTWDVYKASDWKAETVDGSSILELLVGREPLPGPRRPVQFALAQTPDFAHVTIEADARPRGRSLIIVFAYRDPSHFNYAHFSADTAEKQPVHNGIFHVYGGERVRISSQAGPPAFAETNHWYHVVLDYNGTTGDVKGSADGIRIPALHAVDLSLSSGRIGVGSFDEVGDFRNVRITARH
jgi:hypothetical protein